MAPRKLGVCVESIESITYRRFVNHWDRILAGTRHLMSSTGLENENQWVRHSTTECHLPAGSKISPTLFTLN